MTVCRKDEFIVPENAVPGDVLVLTKALGTQLAVNAHQWLRDPNLAHRWDQIKSSVTEDQVETAFGAAMRQMCRLNLTGAKLMHKHHAHAATDVTGFGIMGHANNLAQNQRAAVDFEIHTLPIIKDMTTVASFAPGFKLMDGYSAETSGGLLVALSEVDAAAFIAEIEAVDKVRLFVGGWEISFTLPSSQFLLACVCSVLLGLSAA